MQTNRTLDRLQISLLDGDSFQRLHNQDSDEVAANHLCRNLINKTVTSGGNRFYVLLEKEQQAKLMIHYV